VSCGGEEEGAGEENKSRRGGHPDAAFKEIQPEGRRRRITVKNAID